MPHIRKDGDKVIYRRETLPATAKEADIAEQNRHRAEHDKHMEALKGAAIANEVKKPSTQSEVATPAAATKKPAASE